MTADTLLKQARTEDALELLQSEIKRRPGDAGLRLSLLQVLLVNGEWDRAAVQLETAASLNPKLEMMADLLGGLLILERQRADTFSGGQTPVIEPTAAWLEALAQVRAARGKAALTKAAKVHAGAMAAAPARRGRVDGDEFNWFSDADGRLGPAIELYAAGKYTWMPLEAVRSLLFKAPTEFFDLVWLPVTATTTAGTKISGHMPTRYPGTETAKDAEERLARTVSWTQHGTTLLFGSGVRVFSTDRNDYPVTRLRRVEFSG